MSKNKLKITSFLIAGIAVVIVGTIVLQSFIGNLYVKKFECVAATASPLTQDYDSTDLSLFPAPGVEFTGYEMIAATDKAALFLKSDNQGIKLFDKRTGKIWASSPEQEVINLSATSTALKKRMSSLFTFNYIDLTNIRESKKEVMLCDESPIITREKIVNGVCLGFNFEKYAIDLKLNFTLVGDELYCTIPNNGIVENEEKAVEITKKKEDIQNKIDEFQNLSDEFQKELESSDYDSTVINVIKIFSNEIFNLLVKAKETTGTESFQPAQFENIQTDIVEIKKRLKNKTDNLYDMITQMEKDITKIIKVTDELSKTRAGGITDFTLMPFFGTGMSGDNGYVFYPDECGAISKLNVLHSEASGIFNQDVYDSFSPSEKSKRLDRTSTKTINTSLYPVFGVKVDNSAFAAVISKGDTDASIHFNPVTNSNAFGNVYSNFYFRQMTSDSNQKGEVFSVYDRTRIKQDWEMTYKLLSDNDATYSGMANFYRDYLQRNNMLSRSPLMDKEMPLTTQFMMGMEPKQESLFRNYIKLTDFSDIKTFAEDLEKEGISSLMVDVNAWCEHYGKLSWQPLNPAEEIGGKKGLRELSTYFKEKNNVLSFDNTGYSYAEKDLPRTIRTNATVKALNTISLKIQETLYLNPFYAYSKQKDDLKDFKDYGINAINYSDMSFNLYYDYNKNGSTNRAQTAAVFNKIVKDSKETIPYSVQNNASSLYLNQTDWNIYMPEETSGYIFTDAEVPFYQMVCHGLIPYTSSPLNEASDIGKAKLKRIELGELPFYRLTSELPAQLKLWYNAGLYSPKISNWFSEIVTDYKEYYETYSGIWNKLMLSHEELATDVYRICYEGGTEVIVNYSQNEYTYNGHTVPGQGSIVI